MEDACSKIVQEIQSSGRQMMLIAIDGRCAAGKTTLADLLKKETGCSVIHMDHFFLRREQRTRQRMQEPGGNVDYERFVKEVMLPLSRKEAFSYRVYDCKRMELSSAVYVEPEGAVVIEGSYSCHPALWDFYDLRVFMDVSPKEQIQRIRCRNGSEAALKFRNRWIPLEENYFAACRIRERCDLVFQI